MGVAKAALECSVRYLAVRSRAAEHPRQRDLGRSGEDARRRRHLRLLGHPQVYRDRAPLRRNIEAGEVGDTGLFLISDAARGITGEVLYVDGGYHVMGM